MNILTGEAAAASGVSEIIKVDEGRFHIRTEIPHPIGETGTQAGRIEILTWRTIDDNNCHTFLFYYFIHCKVISKFLSLQ